MNDRIKKILSWAGIVLLFLALSYAYMYPVLEGKIVNQSDISGWTGMTHEIVEHNKANPDDPTLWTNSMFGGMPSVTMYDDFDGDLTNPLYRFLLLGRRPATYIFIALLGSLFLLLAAGCGKAVAVAGAIAMAFCSYNMQIIQVGHNTKMQAIAFFPWVLAALIYTYRSAEKEGKLRDWLPYVSLEAVLFAFALSFQIKANHPQITWYLAATVFIYAAGELIYLLCKKERRRGLGRFFAASALLLVIGCAGIATNANKLLPTWNYAKYTMRGGSELSREDGSAGSKGLELDYATAWSYGIEETPNLVIPDYNGGASASELGKDSASSRELQKYGYKGRQLDQVLEGMPTYWGPQPFTAGPMYIGALSFFLFLLGCLLCSGKEKWWLIAASILALLLAWGSHFMGFTKLCFNLLPMYNKFRTVSMALIVLQYTLPLLGFLALDKLCRGDMPLKEVRRKLLVAGGVTMGIFALLFLLQRLLGSFAGAADPEFLAKALREDRMELLRADTIRSIGLVLLATAALWLMSGWKRDSSKASTGSIMAVMMAVLVLIDLVGVDRRYLNSAHFVSKKEFRDQFEARPVDRMILQDEDPDYRVLDLSVNTFNDSHPSYWHKSIGGYSPAKLQRYQDLIDRYLLKEMNSVIAVVNAEGTISGVEENFPSTPVLNMLNTRYVILGSDYPPVVNASALGNCWFVDEVVPAASADEEIALLGSCDPGSAAVVRTEDMESARMESLRHGTEGGIFADMDDIRLTSYKANELHYSYACAEERLAVFSEIWHPGWKASLNGEPLEIIRADWVLRAAVLPAGEGEIVMRYEPDDYRIGRDISLASSILLYLLAIVAAAGMLAGKPKETKRK